MNILILTPDRVGSTLLQRYITVMMQEYDYGKPVINLHELTNGLQFKPSLEFPMDILTKPNKETWGYYQSLSEITHLLKKAEHYKTSRLALYHIVNRKDSLPDQLSFYQYLNDNFFIISARRENLFEHALSWCIVAASKHLNVYSAEEKMNAFNNIYEQGITVDPEVFKTYLNRYQIYLEWVDRHFNVNSYFNYEKDINSIDEYVSKLDIFPANTHLKTWEDVYGISWKEWNTCHYLNSSQHNLLLSSTKPLELEYSKTTGTALATVTNNLATQSAIKFLESRTNSYNDANSQIAKLVKDDVLVTPIPIKLQTLAEKSMIVKNFMEVIDTYNDWCQVHKIDKVASEEDLYNSAITELTNLYGTIHNAKQLTS